MPKATQNSDNVHGLSASARLNSWAMDTLARVTTEEPDKRSEFEAQIKEDGNNFLAWAFAWCLPMFAMVAIGIEVDSGWQWLFWGLGFLAGVAVFLNMTQALWAKRRRAALDSKIALELMTALEVQRKQNDEILRRIKATEERINRLRGNPDFDI